MLNRKVEKYRRKHMLISITAVLIVVILLLLVIFGKNIFGYIGINFDNVPTAEYIEIKDLTTNDNIQNQDKQLNIFHNKTNESDDFNGEPVIYPGASGTFEMLIYNRIKSPMEVNIFLSDVNKDKINLMYRISIDDIYHYGDKKTFLTMPALAEPIYRIIAPQTYIKVTIEWKWVTLSDESDTAIGMKPRAQYILNLRVDATKYVTTIE